MIQTVQHKSPNFGARPAGTPVSAIVLHADAATSVESSIAWCCDRASKVSYHAIIDRRGRLHALVSTDKRAWHAGVSSFAGVPDCNDYSVGLCFANAQDGKEPFTPEQIATGVTFCAALMRLYPAITPERITTHEAVALPHGRKHDPGPRFPLADFLARIRTEASGGHPSGD